MITMEKIDYVMAVTGAEYEVVRAALLTADGDVDLAIKIIQGEEPYTNKQEDQTNQKAGEEKKGQGPEDVFKGVVDFADEILKAVREIIEKGNATRLVITDDEDRTILNISLNAGAIWSVLAPLASLLGVSYGFLTKWEFFIYLDDGKVINVKDYILKKHRMR